MKLPTRFRALILGAPKAGKTGAILSLLEAGYRVIYTDFDRNSEILGAASPAASERLVYLPFEDKVRKTGSQSTLAGVSGEAKAHLRYMEFLETGKYVSPDGAEKEDHGPMSSWGSDTVHVTDSMTSHIEAIWSRYLSLKNKTMRAKQDWGAIVNEYAYVCDMLMAYRLDCHSIVIAHTQTQGDETLDEDTRAERRDIAEHNNKIKQEKLEIFGGLRLFPRAVTKAQSEIIAGKFPCVLPFEVDAGGKRIINLAVRKEIPVAVPATASKLPRILPAETGLLQIMQAVTGQKI